MSKLLLSACVAALVVGFMPIANAQYYDDEGSRVGRRHYDDDYRPSRRHYDDDDYYRPRRPHRSDYEDEDYHRHAPVIIIHPPSWVHPGSPSYGGNERPSWGSGGPERRPTTGSTDNRPNWEKENRPPTKEEWNGPGGGYGGKQ
jgi:hypothetical protein